MNLSKPELETVLRCVDKVFDFRAERDRLRDLLATLEAENKSLAARVSELEALEKQRAADEAWANERTVLVEFHPVTSGWHAFALGVVKRFNAVEPTIHGALRALREKMEARP